MEWFVECWGEEYENGQKKWRKNIWWEKKKGLTLHSLLRTRAANIEKNYNRQEVVQELTLRATGAKKRRLFVDSEKQEALTAEDAAVGSPSRRIAAGEQQTTNKKLDCLFCLALSG